MIKQQKPLLLAYIIFLFISIIYHVVSSLFQFEFSEWQRIVVAATIASYAFSVSSGYKFLAKSSANLLAFSKERLELLKDLNAKESMVFTDDEKREDLLKTIQICIEKSKESISQREKEIHKFTKITFSCDVIGYLLFFCIFAFRPLYDSLKSSQEIITLFAFIMILLVEYAEATFMTKIEERYRTLNEQIKENIKNIEERANLLHK